VGGGKKTQHGRGDERFSFIKLETGVSSVFLFGVVMETWRFAKRCEISLG